MVERIAVSQCVAGIAAAHLLLLGEQIACGDSSFRAGFQDAAAGRFERQVLIGGRRNQVIQGRIVERRPPTGVVVFQAFQPGIVGVDPVFGGCWRKECSSSVPP